MSAERLATLRRTVDRKMRELSLTQDRRRRTDLEREIRAAQAEIERLRPVTQEPVRRQIPAANGMPTVGEIASRQGRAWADFLDGTVRNLADAVRVPLPLIVHDEIIVESERPPREEGLRTFRMTRAVERFVSARDLARVHGTGPQLTEAVIQRNTVFESVMRRVNKQKLERIAREHPELIEELIAKRQPAKVAPTPSGRRLIV